MISIFDTKTRKLERRLSLSDGETIETRTLTSEELDRLSHSGKSIVRLQVAADDKTPSGALERLCEDRDEAVRAVACSNQNSPVAALKRNADKEIARGMKGEYKILENICANKGVGAELLEYVHEAIKGLTSPAADRVKWAMAGNPHITRRLAYFLLEDPTFDSTDVGVRILLENPAVPYDLLWTAIHRGGAKFLWYKSNALVTLRGKLLSELEDKQRSKILAAIVMEKAEGPTRLPGLEGWALVMSPALDAVDGLTDQEVVAALALIENSRLPLEDTLTLAKKIAKSKEVEEPETEEKIRSAPAGTMKTIDEANETQLGIS